MTDEDVLRTALRTLVPEPPESAIWAAPAVTRGRALQRRRRIGLTATLSAAVVAVLVPVLLLQRSEPGVTAPTDDPRRTQKALDPNAADPCPTLGAGEPSAAEVTTTQLRSIRACVAPTTRGVFAQWAPSDALTVQLWLFTEDVAALPDESGDPGASCTDTGRPDLVLVLTDADGRAAQIKVADCERVRVDGRTVSTARLYDLFTARLLAQRQVEGAGNTASTLPNDYVRPLCEAEPTRMRRDPAIDSFVVATVCGPNGAARPLVARFTPPAEKAWTSARVGPVPQCAATKPSPGSYLAFETQFGDIVRISDRCRTVIADDTETGESYVLDTNETAFLRWTR